MGMLKESKEFAVKGNVMDMAVGIIIDAAFARSCRLSWATSSCRRLGWLSGVWISAISP